MNAWKLSTEECSVKERSRLWQRGLDKLHMPSCNFDGNEAQFHGDISCVYTPQGIEFSVMSGSPLEISGKSGDQPYPFWLALLLEGDFSLKYRGEEMVAETGSIIYAPTGLDLTLSVKSDFRLLYVKIPSSLVNARLLNPSLINVGHLPCDSGINQVFATMLTSLSNNIDELESSMLRPIEIALSEFVVSNLIHESGVQEFGSTAKILHFKRICQLIDANLADPALSLNLVAEKYKVSSRYIQKLFESGGISFVNYVRMRRLDRCRCELGNPEYNHLSVSDICFRWGFNDAGHFSRTFRAAFGMTPRDYRRQQQESATGDKVVETIFE